MKNTKYVLQITSGRGPHECTWVVAQVLRELLREANLYSIDAKVINKADGHLPGTVASAFVEITHNSKDYVNSWIGTVQWIGLSPFRKFHKRKNWFIGVFLTESLDENVFNERDVVYQAIRSAGAGGQNVNKVATAVRATHSASGLQVLAMDTRSQLQNKKLALERLKEKFIKMHYEKLEARESLDWLNQTSIERGNAIRTYEGPKFRASLLTT